MRLYRSLGGRLTARIAVALATAAVALGGLGASTHVARASISVPEGFLATDYVSVGQRLTAMAWSSDGRLFISQKDGNLRVVKNNVLLTTPFLTLPVNTTSERGLLGVALDPAFGPANPYIYVYYTFADTQQNRISRFSVSANNPDVGNPASELVLLDNIPSDLGAHNGGALHFGPDGKLYASVGDLAYGPNAQDMTTLAGKMLRINRDGTLPADNPFVGVPATRSEIWALGLRNPYTFAFQQGSGRLFINDVGNNTVEEIDQGAKGANYGWPICEGPCADPSYTDPIYSYKHTDGPGKAITGAEFYSGSTFPAEYQGDYFFGDYVGFYIKRYDPQTGQVYDFATDARYVADIRTGPDGALYYLSVEAKKVVRIQYTGVVNPPPTDSQVSISPSADVHVASGAPTTNYGHSPLLYVRSTNDVDRVFMKWDLSALAGQEIQGATLRFHTSGVADAGSTANEQVHLVTDGSWTETGTTYNSQPALGTVLADIGPTVPDTDYSISLPENVVQSYVGGSFSIGIDSPGPRDTMYFYSRDSAANRPSLLIDYMTPPPSIGEPPQPVIDAPSDGTVYHAGDTIDFSGSATDPEDGPINPANLTWEIVFHHDTHTHPFIEPFSGATSGSFVIPNTGEASGNTWYRIHLKATDSDGNSAEVTRDVVPLKSTQTLATNPPGLSLLLDGSPITAPYTFVGVQGFKRQITAPATQTLGGHTYQFVSWSDGGNADHTLVTPEYDGTITATYVDVTNQGTHVVSDAFNRTVNGGWSSADVGGPYTVSGGTANFKVANGTATITLPNTGANKSATLESVSLTDADITFRVAVDKVATGNSEYAYAEVRVLGNNSYRPKIVFNANGTISVHAGKVVNGSESSVAPPVVVPGLTQTAGAFYWLRAQVTSTNPTTIKVKAWADGQPEPAAWQFSATNSNAPLQGAGAVALRAYSRSTNAPVTFTFDDYSVAGPETAPGTPPPTFGTAVAGDAFTRTISGGWGSSTTGGTYTLTGNATTFAVNGSSGLMTLPKAGATRIAVLADTSATDFDARVRISTDKATVGGNWYGYLMLRHQANSAYQPKIIVHADGTVSVQAGLLIDGSESPIGAAVVVPGLTYTPGTAIWLRAQVSGTSPTTINVMAWADGQPEPLAWQFTATNSNAALQSAGAIGLRAYIGGHVEDAPVVVSFDDLAVTTTP